MISKWVQTSVCQGMDGIPMVYKQVLLVVKLYSNEYKEGVPREWHAKVYTQALVRNGWYSNGVQTSTACYGMASY